MARIIGFMTTWGAGPFVEPALKQGLENCDEFLVLVGPHHCKMEPFKDKTEEICRKHVELVRSLEISEPYTTWRAKTLNMMLDCSNVHIGDWLYLVDVDEFFFKKDFQRLKKCLDQYDSVRFEEKYFIVDMKHYVTKTSSPRLWRYNGGRFKPTDKWTVPFENMLTTSGMFHYSLLMNPYAKKVFWATERQKPQPHKSNWIDDVYLKYNIENEKRWLAGTYGIGFGSDNGNLFIYEGKHPEYIEEAGLLTIKDFRDIW